MSNGPSKSNTEGKVELSPDAVYNSITQLVVNSESISWSRLYYYLVAVSLLTVAWVGLFTATNHSLLFRCLSFAVAFIGFIISLQWYGLGKRSRAFQKLYLKLGCRFEMGDEKFRNLSRNLPIKLGFHEIIGEYKKYCKYQEVRIPVNTWEGVNAQYFGNILPFTETTMELEKLKYSKPFWRFYTSTCIFKVVTIAFMVLFSLMAIVSCSC